MLSVVMTDELPAEGELDPGSPPTEGPADISPEEAAWLEALDERFHKVVTELVRQTRQMLKEGAAQIPQLAEQLGVDIVTLRIFGPDHIVLAVVEANDIEPVREFILQSRLIQWNTTNIHATYSVEEALAKADVLETIF